MLQINVVGRVEPFGADYVKNHVLQKDVRDRQERTDLGNFLKQRANPTGTASSNTARPAAGIDRPFSLYSGSAPITLQVPTLGSATNYKDSAVSSWPVRDDGFDDELYVHDTLVIWSRDNMLIRTYDFSSENQPIIKAFFAYFPTAFSCNGEPPIRQSRETPPVPVGSTHKNSHDAATPYKTPSAEHGYRNGGDADTVPVGGDVLERALVVLLRDVARIHMLDTGRYLIAHLPFIVRDAWPLAGGGILLQREFDEGNEAISFLDRLTQPDIDADTVQQPFERFIYPDRPIPGFPSSFERTLPFRPSASPLPPADRLPNIFSLCSPLDEIKIVSFVDHIYSCQTIDGSPDVSGKVLPFAFPEQTVQAVFGYETANPVNLIVTFDSKLGGHKVWRYAVYNVSDIAPTIPSFSTSPGNDPNVSALLSTTISSQSTTFMSHITPTATTPMFDFFERDSRKSGQCIVADSFRQMQSQVFLQLLWTEGESER